MNRKFHHRGYISQEMQVCSDIIEKYQKERFDQLKKKDPRMIIKDIKKVGKVVGVKYEYRNVFNTLVKKDLKMCEREILSCCQGEFPKSSY